MKLPTEQVGHAVPVAVSAGRIGRSAFGVVLVLLFAGSIGWIVIGWPLPFRTWIALAVVSGGSLAAFLAFFVPSGLNERYRRSLTAGAACAALIAALVAVPALQDGSSEEPEPPLAGSPPPSQSQEEPVPLTAQLHFDEDPEGCERLAIPRQQLRSLPERPNFNARWAYDRGGGTANLAPYLIVQGKSNKAVILRSIEIIDVTRRPVDKNAAVISTCIIGGGATALRFFELDFKHEKPKVIARPSEQINEGGEKGQPAVKFPFRVSESDPEFFLFEITGPPCLCEWRLALNWSSGEQYGQLILDREFSRIVTHMDDYKAQQYQWDADGTFDPPLPK